jgi:mevalonate kinase
VSVPGKLILMGEHAVVYGRPALVAAVDLRLFARFSPSPVSGVTLHPGKNLEALGLASGEPFSWADIRAYTRQARGGWEAYARDPGPEGFRRMRGLDPAHVVKVALGEAADFLDGLPGSGTPAGDPPLDLHLDSDLPVGSGFGSSAAAAAAIVTGYLLYRGAAVPLETIEPLALEVERRQHGTPSGVDTAAVLRGGVLWARKLATGGLETEAATLRSPLLSRLQVYDTGTPAEATGAVVAAVRALRGRDPGRHEAILDRMEAATRAFRAELEREEEDPGRAVELIREHQACLEELGVVPPEVRNLVRQVEKEGGAAKISGAGSLSGPGAGSLLVYDPGAERFAGWAFLQPYPNYPVHLGATGLRREAV